MTMIPKIYLTSRLPADVMARLDRETDLAWNKEPRPATRAELLSGIEGRAGLLCNINDRIDAEILNSRSATRLKVVANFGVGFNNIDVSAATAGKIAVTNTPGVLTEATADMAFALLLAVARRLGEGERLVRSSAWTGWEPLQMLGADISGATLGIIGFGRIGRALAQRARGFGMRVIYWNRSPLETGEGTATGGTSVSMETLLSQADFISLHVAYHPATHHLIGEAELKLMKPTAYLINTSRGAVIDEAALVAALSNRNIAGAGLDVYEREPLLVPGLSKLDNVVLTPHLGSATLGTRARMGMIAVDNLLAACAGQRPPNCVNPELFEATVKGAGLR
jgi:glyoxylate reductase